MYIMRAACKPGLRTNKNMQKKIPLHVISMAHRFILQIVNVQFSLIHINMQSNKPLSEGLSHQIQECNWYGRWSRVVHYLCLNVMLKNLYRSFISLSFLFIICWFHLYSYLCYTLYSKNSLRYKYAYARAQLPSAMVRKSMRYNLLHNSELTLV